MRPTTGDDDDEPLRGISVAVGMEGPDHKKIRFLAINIVSLIFTAQEDSRPVVVD
jgi:hypothetical protein